MTNFLGSLEAAKYLKTNGALSLINKNPFILEIKKRSAGDGNFQMRCISSRLNVLNACWICLPAKLLTLANLCFQGEELKVKTAVRCISGRAENRKQIGTTACGARMLGSGRMFAYLDREQASHPTHCWELDTLLTTPGNQGSLWDAVGLCYFFFFLLKLFLYGYLHYSFLFGAIFIFF